MTVPASQKHLGHGLAFVGCFTTAKRQARGKGIQSYRTGPNLGDWKLLDTAENLINPSWLIADADYKMLYVAHGDGDYATAFSIDPQTGALREHGQAKTGGKNGVHLVLDATRKFLIVVNYASGSLAVLPVAPDGSLGDAQQVLELPGTAGTHKHDQLGSHPHQIIFDPSKRFLIVPDKGVDRVFVLNFQDGKLNLLNHFEQRPGAGPRHVVFHPSLPLAFLLNELESSVVTCEWDALSGVLKPIDLVSTAPSNFFGANATAEIAITPDGSRIYVSNRGHDSIVHFDFDARTKKLNAVDWTNVNGSSPRFITFDPTGDHLLVAAEQSDFISEFKIDKSTGRLSATERKIETLSPCTIAFF